MEIFSRSTWGKGQDKMKHRIPTIESVTNLVENIGEDFKLPEWFMNECRTLILQDKVFSPFASLGLVGRVALVTVPENERKALLKKMSKNMLPARRIASWWNNHRDVVWKDLEHESHERVIRLMRLTFDIWKPDSEHSIEDMALTWARKRDNLQSILCLVGKKHGERKLIPAIEEADRLAKKLVKHRLPLARHHPRFPSVLEAEPTSWWAAYPALRGDKKMAG